MLHAFIIFLLANVKVSKLQKNKLVTIIFRICQGKLVKNKTYLCGP